MDSNISNASKDVKDTRAEVHSSIDRMVSSAHSGVDKVADRIDSVSEQLSNKGEALNNAYKRFTESGLNYVRSSPGTSVLIALAAGYAVSKLLGARRH